MRKSVIAQSLLRETDLALSAQVLQEFYVQSTRVTRGDPLPRQDAVTMVKALQRFAVMDIAGGLVVRAIDASIRWQISYWDAAVVECARAAGCRILLTEDLQHGQNFDGVQVLNPFS